MNPELAFVLFVLFIITFCSVIALVSEERKLKEILKMLPVYQIGFLVGMIILAPIFVIGFTGLFAAAYMIKMVPLYSSLLPDYMRVAVTLEISVITLFTFALVFYYYCMFLRKIGLSPDNN